MPSESPTAFELGSDLIGVDNLPWRLFVLPLLRAEVAVPVVRILQKDGFLPQRDVERFTLFTDPPTRRPILRDTVISFNHIEEPFGVSFGGVKYGGNALQCATFGHHGIHPGAIGIQNRPQLRSTMSENRRTTKLSFRGTRPTDEHRRGQTGHTRWSSPFLGNREAVRGWAVGRQIVCPWNDDFFHSL
ncbi:hypothetical protein C8Q79DRAFT_485333 [Trametes meyenii]|nr:hypothetical protein C8Q79DRAFT_485333 [Trametes meyenii]